MYRPQRDVRRLAIGIGTALAVSLAFPAIALAHDGEAAADLAGAAAAAGAAAVAAAAGRARRPRQEPVDDPGLFLGALRSAGAWFSSRWNHTSRPLTPDELEEVMRDYHPEPDDQPQLEKNEDNIKHQNSAYDPGGSELGGSGS